MGSEYISIENSFFFTFFTVPKMEILVPIVTMMWIQWFKSLTVKIEECHLFGKLNCFLWIISITRCSPAPAITWLHWVSWRGPQRVTSPPPPPIQSMLALSTAQYSTAQYRTVQNSTVQYSTMLAAVLALSGHLSPITHLAQSEERTGAQC